MARRKKAAGENLVIVESAAKARTIERYLGDGFEVKASVGHVRDLQKSRMGVDIENDFEPKYSVVADRRKVVNDLKAAAKRAGDVYLATDRIGRAKPYLGTSASCWKYPNMTRVASCFTR